MKILIQWQEGAKSPQRFRLYVDFNGVKRVEVEGTDMLGDTAWRTAQDKGATVIEKLLAAALQLSLSIMTGNKNTETPPNIHNETRGGNTMTVIDLGRVTL
jgi:hypothetical protein